MKNNYTISICLLVIFASTLAGCADKEAAESRAFYQGEYKANEAQNANLRQVQEDVHEQKLDLNEESQKTQENITASQERRRNMARKQQTNQMKIKSLQRQIAGAMSALTQKKEKMELLKKQGDTQGTEKMKEEIAALQQKKDKLQKELDGILAN